LEEFRQQTAAGQEKFKKQTAKLTAQSAKLTSAVQSLRSEIKEENDRLAKSLTAKFEAAHDKIRKDFEAKLSSEIVTVSEKIDNVRKNNEGEINELSSTIEVYVSVTEKVDIAVTQTRRWHNMLINLDLYRERCSRLGKLPMKFQNYRPRWGNCRIK